MDDLSGLPVRVALVTAPADRDESGSARPSGSFLCRLQSAKACGRCWSSTSRGPSSRRSDRRCARRTPWRRSPSRPMSWMNTERFGLASRLLQFCDFTRRESRRKTEANSARGMAGARSRISLTLHSSYPLAQATSPAWLVRLLPNAAKRACPCSKLN